MPAKKLNEVDRYFRNKPIEPGQFESFYVPADAGRSPLPTCKLLEQKLINDPDGSLKLLFAGHRGCGKTTELLRLQREIDNDFVTLNFSVVRELDVLNINYIELFIVAMEKLFRFVESEPWIEVSPEYFRSIRGWLKTGEMVEIGDHHLSMDVAGEIKSGVDIPFLARFFGRFRAAAKSSSSIKKTLTTRIEPKLSDLIFHCNAFIREIRGELHKIGKKGLLIIMEDLDKVVLEKGEEIFYVHSTQLTELQCHCIFTFPISLLYYIKFKNIIGRYDGNFTLPMIKVNEKDGRPCNEGREIMRRIVEKRMALDLFEKPGCLDRMIELSGGCLWDLFRLIKDSASSALVLGRARIDAPDFENAYGTLKHDYESTIAENSEKGISVDQYYDALVECVKNPNKKPDHTDIILDLMNNLTILNYNGQNWCDAHPIVKEILGERGKL